jgi:hypothetical protein
MLGLYENFPENIHRIDNFSFSLSCKDLQEKLVMVLLEINSRAVSFDEIGHEALRDCTITLEAGVAESRSFSFIDKEEERKLHNALKKKPFRVLDFFFAARYHRTNEGKKSPLRFDYFLVRTIFTENSLEMRAFHERGPRYTTPEDLVTFLVERINRATEKRILRPWQPKFADVEH